MMVYEHQRCTAAAAVTTVTRLQSAHAAWERSIGGAILASAWLPSTNGSD
jgi:hypothetical protein